MLKGAFEGLAATHWHICMYTEIHMLTLTVGNLDTLKLLRLIIQKNNFWQCIWNTNFTYQLRMTKVYVAFVGPAKTDVNCGSK